MLTHTNSLIDRISTWRALAYVWLVGISAIVFLQFSGTEHVVASYLYSVTGHWETRFHWFFRNVLHLGGRYFVIYIALLAGFLAVVGHDNRQHFLTKLKLQKLLPNSSAYFLCIFFSILLCTVLIGALKKINPITCPYKLIEFGGNLNYYTVADFFNTSQQIGKCFPSGHSASGFSLMSLFFAAQLTDTKPSIKLLLPGLFIGLIFAVTQQIRGAHLISHDIAGFLISWSVCACLPKFILYTSRIKTNANTVIN